ncbi:GNAT family N-acetyltransferase [Modestobacter marinus]|uniref:GNAT family N-acetyltransferase n=1 Tax=Modestobacter marinus TaxID=477641 RepID=UPI00201A8579|nr:GNAT family N-acetyltransferase [Modestobacter marinus]
MTTEAESGTITIEQVDAATTYPLRAQELRQGRPLEIDEDDAPYTLHLAARVDGDEVVGVVRFHPADCPWREGEGSWQLRGMATDPRVRGLGVGRALVAAGLARVAACGGQLVWCDARASAVGFYERLGFTTVTADYDLRAVGTHRGMLVELPIR